MNLVGYYNKVLPDVIEYTQTLYKDHRGYNMEISSNNPYFDIEFVADTMSRSKRNTLRGLHGDYITDKLVQCLYGKLFLVVVDIRATSKTFLKWTSFILSDQNAKQIIIPKGFLNGHVCLSTECIFYYKLSRTYNPKQITIRYDDPLLGIKWPIKDPILSNRDKNAKTFEELYGK